LCWTRSRFPRVRIMETLDTQQIPGHVAKIRAHIEKGETYDWWVWTLTVISKVWACAPHQTLTSPVVKLPLSPTTKTSQVSDSNLSDAQTVLGYHTMFLVSQNKVSVHLAHSRWWSPEHLEEMKEEVSILFEIWVSIVRSSAFHIEYSMGREQNKANSHKPGSTL